MAAEEDELLDAEERAEEQARREAEALAAEAKAAGEQLKKLMKSTNRQDTAKLQVNCPIPSGVALLFRCCLVVLKWCACATSFVGGNRHSADGYRRVRHRREGPT